MSTHCTASQTRNTTMQSLHTRAKQSQSTTPRHRHPSGATTDTHTSALLLWLLLLSVRGVVVAKMTTSSRWTRGVAVSAPLERAEKACESRRCEVASPSAPVCFPRRQASSVAGTVCVTASAEGMLWLRVVVLRKATTLSNREQRWWGQRRDALTLRADWPGAVDRGYDVKVASALSGIHRAGRPRCCCCCARWRSTSRLVAQRAHAVTCATRSIVCAGLAIMPRQRCRAGTGLCACGCKRQTNTPRAQWET